MRFPYFLPLFHIFFDTSSTTCGALLGGGTFSDSWSFFVQETQLLTIYNPHLHLVSSPSTTAPWAAQLPEYYPPPPFPCACHHHHSERLCDGRLRGMGGNHWNQDVLLFQHSQVAQNDTIRFSSSTTSLNQTIQTIPKCLALFPFVIIPHPTVHNFSLHDLL